MQRYPEHSWSENHGSNIHCDRKSFIYLFSGPAHDADMQYCFNQRGWWCSSFDLERSPQHDLVDEEVWTKIEKDLEESVYDAGGAAPPCATFSVARGATQGDGPSPLRGPEAPDIHGLPGLSPDDKEKVRLGTACALRALAMAMILHEAGKPWWTETPLPRDGHPSVFKLPE